MHVLRMAACCMLGAGALMATAQMNTSLAAGPAVGTIAQPSAALDSQLSLIELEMMGTVKAMPLESLCLRRRLSSQPCAPLRSRRRMWQRQTTSSPAFTAA